MIKKTHEVRLDLQRARLGVGDYPSPWEDEFFDSVKGIQVACVFEGSSEQCGQWISYNQYGTVLFGYYGDLYVAAHKSGRSTKEPMTDM